MNLVVVSRLLRCFAAAAVTAVIAGVVPTALNGSSSYRRAVDWVSEQKTLPQTLSELRLYPTDYRRQILSALPAETKVAIWREHLERAAGSPSISSAQRAFLERFRQTLQPEDLAWMSDGSAALAELLAEAPAVMGTHMFILRGPGQESVDATDFSAMDLLRHPSALRVRVGEAVLSGITAQAIDACDCWTDDDGIWDGCGNGGCCPMSYIPDNPQCQRTSGGCSLFDNRPCDGGCCGGGILM